MQLYLNDRMPFFFFFFTHFISWICLRVKLPTAVRLTRVQGFLTPKKLLLKILFQYLSSFLSSDITNLPEVSQIGQAIMKSFVISVFIIVYVRNKMCFCFIACWIPVSFVSDMMSELVRVNYPSKNRHDLLLWNFSSSSKNHQMTALVSWFPNWSWMEMWCLKVYKANYTKRLCCF